MFHVVLTRSGADFQHGVPLEQQTRWPEHAAYLDALVDSGFVVLGGPLPDERRVVIAIQAASEEDVRAVLAQDPWSGTHLQVDSVEVWSIRLDGRVATA
jgi:uncharacterized protein YciI